MPHDVGVIDLMIASAVPPTAGTTTSSCAADSTTSESLEDFKFPAQYMFKDVPDLEPTARPGANSSSSRWTCSTSSRA